MQRKCGGSNATRVMRRIFTASFLVLVLTATQPSLSQTQRELYEGAAGQTAIGPPYEGFALSLTADTPTVHLGAPIWVTVELRNISGRDGTAQFGPRFGGYYFTVINQTTHAVVKRDPNALFGLDSIRGTDRGPIIPANVSFYGKFRLDILYPITQPGPYSVQVTRGQPIIDNKLAVLQSNSISITVLP
jgi:hypothetical protein